MKKLREVFDLSPPKISFCVAFMLFSIMMASLMTYSVVVFINEYAEVKDILVNGQLVEAKFKEVGRQNHQTGNFYGDGYDYFGIYEYYDSNGNCYITETSREFRSANEVLKYVEAHPTKSIYIDGKGHSRSGSETLTKYTSIGVAVSIIALLFYAMLVAFTVQLVRRIKMDKAKEAQR
ncbi:MAG: hypothetical protein K2M75_04660 [Clostridia bacterium]|nr:hypothetical protein [Clostridia bacterium]